MTHYTRILYFTGTRRTPDDTPLAWVQKSYVLSDQVEQREKRKNLCGGASGKIDEFLYRLSAGNRRGDLLTEASALVDDNSPETTIVLKYLSGSLDDTGFQAEVKTFKGERSRCSLYFRGMWYAQILKNHATAEEYLKHLSEDGQFWCQTEVEFAKKLHD